MPQAFQTETPSFAFPSSGAAKLSRRVATALVLTAVLGGAWVQAAPAPVAAPVSPPPGIYKIDPVHTFVVFSAQHKVVGRVRGRFENATGTITVDKDLSACAIDVTIDPATVSTQNATRDEDLRGPAFFDVKAAPSVTYRGRGVRATADGWEIDGQLTIRGISKSVPLRFTYNGVAPAKAGQPARIAFHATAGTRRAEFGMVRGLADEVGDSTGLDVTLEIDVEALAAPAAP